MNRISAVAVAAVLAVAGMTAGTASAQYPPSAATPAGYPPTVQNAGQTSPARPAKPSPKVEVFPFEPVGNPGPVDWAGKGIQASLQSDVSHTGAVLVMTPAGPPEGTDPVAAAKAAGADLAVVGTYQVQGNDVRADGHLIDVNTGRPVGGFSGRAPVGSVFQLEDAVGEQLRHLLPLEASAAPTATLPSQFQPAPGSYNYNGTVPGPTTPAVPPSTTTVIEPVPTYTEPATINNTYVTEPTTAYSYPDSFYGGYDGGYGYGYPYGFYGYDPFVFGFYGGFYGGYGHGYDHGYGNGRGYGGYGRGYGYGGGLHSNPTFYGGGRGGYVLNNGGGRSYGVGGGGLHSAAGFAGHGGGGFGGFGGGGGGGFHGGGGGGHR